ACAWAMAGVPDSAFFNLFRVAERIAYSDIDRLVDDKNLVSLHGDKKWEVLTQKIAENKNRKEKYRALVASLDSIDHDDQDLRKALKGSTDTRALWKQINFRDSLNLIKIEAILDKYGWLGPAEIGEDG